MGFLASELEFECGALATRCSLRVEGSQLDALRSVRLMLGLKYRNELERIDVGGREIRVMIMWA